MAPNKSRNTYDVKDLIKNVSAKDAAPKPKIGYIRWVKTGGWKSIGIVIGIVGLLGAVIAEKNDRPRRQARIDAHIIMDQGIKPVEQINRNRFKDEQSTKFGQSSLKDEKIE